MFSLVPDGSNDRDRSPPDVVVRPEDIPTFAPPPDSSEGTDNELPPNLAVNPDNVMTFAPPPDASDDPHHEPPRDRHTIHQVGTIEKSPATWQSLVTATSRRRMRPIRPGLSVGNVESPRAAGTICCIVQDLRARDGEVHRYLLASEQVLAPPGSLRGNVIVQPGPVDRGIADRDQVATLQRWMPIEPEAGSEIHVAGALARLLPEIETSNGALGMTLVSEVAEVQPGDIVITVGRNSPCVRGKVAAIDQDVLVRRAARDDTTVTYKNMIRVVGVDGARFTTVVDLGAPVVTEDRLLVGMLGADHKNQPFVMPIRRVLEAFEVELVR
jgi:hypothetical protein